MYLGTLQGWSCDLRGQLGGNFSPASTRRRCAPADRAASTKCGPGMQGGFFHIISNSSRKYLESPPYTQTRLQTRLWRPVYAEIISVTFYDVSARLFTL
jgi:hypothetical protein